MIERKVQLCVRSGRRSEESREKSDRMTGEFRRIKAIIIYIFPQTVVDMIGEKSKTEYGVSRYFILTALLSFLGWAFETVCFFVITGGYRDRGFMTLPFCPIYGCSLTIVYFALGTPDEGAGLLAGAKRRGVRYALYLAFAFLIPTAMEFIVGLFFDRALQIRLWDYSTRFWNIRGYVCLRNSFIWAGLIFLFMRFVFPFFKDLVGRLPKPAARALALVLLVLSLIDASVNFARVL